MLIVTGSEIMKTGSSLTCCPHWGRSSYSMCDGDSNHRWFHLHALISLLPQWPIKPLKRSNIQWPPGPKQSTLIPANRKNITSILDINHQTCRWDDMLYSDIVNEYFCSDIVNEHPNAIHTAEERCLDDSKLWLRLSVS